VARAEKRLADAKAAVTPLEADLTAAQKRRDYLAQNPDLPAQAHEEGGVVVEETTTDA
jgi:hypothetical protein